MKKVFIKKIVLQVGVLTTLLEPVVSNEIFLALLPVQQGDQVRPSLTLLPKSFPIFEIGKFLACIRSHPTPSQYFSCNFFELKQQICITELS